MKKNKIKLDKYHYHEALDRSYCVADMIENMLVTHPVIEKHKKIRKHIKKAQRHILEAYQLIGGKNLK
jgi:cell fate (sporulation/competence/biofilm development) regulator YmcA (YheA/YmcA/DUF963 family)